MLCNFDDSSFAIWQQLKIKKKTLLIERNIKRVNSCCICSRQPECVSCNVAYHGKTKIPFKVKICEHLQIFTPTGKTAMTITPLVSHFCSALSHLILTNSLFKLPTTITLKFKSFLWLTLSWLRSKYCRNQSMPEQINGLVSIWWDLLHERVKP